MALTKEQSNQIKDELRKQLVNLPAEKQEDAKRQIEEMTDEQLEILLKQNQEEINKDAGSCIFCQIVKGATSSIKVDENEEAVAVMDINPISKGHVLVVPKNHEGEPTQKSQELAFEIGGRILEKLSPKDITTRAAKIMDHTILNVVPIYEDTDFEKRIKMSNQELLDISKKISDFKEPEKPVKVDSEPVETYKMPEIQNACLFCSIINESSPSFKIDENKENTAILEVNPVSKGHTLIIPRIHDKTTKLPQNSFSLAKKIAKKITNKYKPNDVKINPTSINNHALIELIPIYKETDPSKRIKLSDEELKKIQEELKVKKKSQTKKTTKKSSKKKASKKLSPPKPKYPSLPQMPRRIP